MGMVKSIQSMAVERGAIALRTFADASLDGRIEGDELRTLGGEMKDWFLTVVGSRDALATGLAFMRGISDMAYQDDLLARYRESRDEVPPLEVA